MTARRIVLMAVEFIGKLATINVEGQSWHAHCKQIRKIEMSVDHIPTKGGGT